jgi:hypothetical protein
VIFVNVSTALEKVEKAVEDFRTETNMLFAKGSSDPAKVGDLEELSRQTYYALSSIEAAIKELADQGPR